MKNLIFTVLLIVPFLAIHSQDTIHVPADYTTIQAGINASNNGDILLVAEGTYYENINFNGKAITVASHFLIDGDNEHIIYTIINANDSGSVVVFDSGEDTTSILCGFTVTGGNDGGINCDSSGAKIINNHVEENENGRGGGINANGSDWIIIEGNIISSNVARGVRIGSGDGGGINIKYIQEGRISNNLISQNLALRRERNSWGGAISIEEVTSLLIVNNIIVENAAESGHGGGIYIHDDTQPILINNTIANNKADYGGGIHMYEETIIMNNIIWGNTAAIADSQIYCPIGIPQIFYSDIQGGWSGVGNIDAYPEFVDTAGGDYHLKNSSRCIGAGIDSLEIAGVWYYCPIIDLEGNPRPNPPGTMPDMGAYESPLSVSGIEDYLTQVPKAYSLEQNYPNPFNPSTKIRYTVPQPSNVIIKVFDILGNEIEVLVKEEKPVGTYEITWYAEKIPSGIYFYQLKADNYVETKKMILIK
jgi:parallel beta-helix repeat protein